MANAVYSTVSQGELNEVKCNLGKVNHEPICPVVSLICGMAARACLAMCKPLTGLPWNLPVVLFRQGPHQPLMAPVPKLINWQ